MVDKNLITLIAQQQFKYFLMVIHNNVVYKKDKNRIW